MEVAARQSLRPYADWSLEAFGSRVSGWQSIVTISAVRVIGEFDNIRKSTAKHINDMGRRSIYIRKVFVSLSYKSIFINVDLK